MATISKWQPEPSPDYRALCDPAVPITSLTSPPLLFPAGYSVPVTLASLLFLQQAEHTLSQGLCTCCFLCLTQSSGLHTVSNYPCGFPQAHRTHRGRAPSPTPSPPRMPFRFIFLQALTTRHIYIYLFIQCLSTPVECPRGQGLCFTHC